MFLLPCVVSGGLFRALRQKNHREVRRGFAKDAKKSRSAYQSQITARSWEPEAADTICWMNPAALYFASGDSLYLGAGLLVLAVATAPNLRRPWLAALRSIASWLGLAMMVMASPPFSWWVITGFGATFVLWLITSRTGRIGINWLGLRRTAIALLLALLVVLPASELLHRGMPNVHGLSCDHLVVIGDSISAGIDPRVPTWPMVMQRKTGIAVKNLSQPGAGVTEAQTMSTKVTPEDTVVLIEIGGNDLLSGVSSHEFSLALESLLSRLDTPGRTLVMFELPLLPHRISYGQIQRRLAKRYQAFLIPKRYFTSVLSGANATSDGLHLSEVGAQRMAALVAQTLAPVLKPTVRPGAPATLRGKA